MIINAHAILVIVAAVIFLIEAIRGNSVMAAGWCILALAHLI